jgi:hypothetical protein
LVEITLLRELAENSMTSSVQQAGSEKFSNFFYFGAESI